MIIKVFSKLFMHNFCSAPVTTNINFQYVYFKFNECAVYFILSYQALNSIYKAASIYNPVYNNYLLV